MQAAETSRGKRRIKNERLESAGTMIPVVLIISVLMENVNTMGICEAVGSKD